MDFARVLNLLIKDVRKMFPMKKRPFQKRTLLISNIFRKFPYLQLTLNQIKIIAELKIGDETECNVESDYYGDLCSTQNDLNDDDGVCRQNFS